MDREVRRPSWTVVIGGTPLRVLRLGPRGARLIDAWQAGQPVGVAPAAGAFARRLVDAGFAHPRPPDGPAPKVSVVIPVRDREIGLRSTLAAVGDSGVVGVVVVDDGSATPVERDPDWNERVSVVRRDSTGGPAAARNAGWRAACSEVVVFLDADCLPVGDWIRMLGRHFADPAVAAVAPRIVSPAGTPGAVRAYESCRSPLDLGDRESTVRPRSRVPYVPTACLAVRRACLESVGGFDESLRYGEDVDLVWRLNDAGWSVRYEPGARVEHPPRPDVPSLLRQRFDYGRSAAPLARRHGDDVAPLAISPWSLAAWGLLAAGQPGAASVVTAGSAAVLAQRAGKDVATAKELARLALRGNLMAGGRLAEAVRRAWAPPALAFLAAAPSARARRRIVAALVGVLAVPLVEWAGERPPLGPVLWTALRTADDLAYQAGVWAGVVRERSGRALLPRF
ncbi:MAG TPA: mycofactocin biosynthesis glycosyltransferase MftF [Acidimicrobiales bacterium]|nr:mycofactocin biosynthesis glycosyltransferase MftF [Acidimicrobiales bacterium]